MAGSTGRIKVLATLRFGQRRKDYIVGYAIVGEDSAGRAVLDVRMLSLSPHGRVMLSLGDLRRLLDQAAEAAESASAPPESE